MAEDNTRNFGIVRLKGVDDSAGFRLPHMEEAFAVGRGDQLAVAAENSRQDFFPVAGEILDHLTGLHVPDGRRTFFANDQQLLTIRAESDGVDERLDRNSSQRLSAVAGRVPEFHAVLAIIGDGNASAVTIHGQAGDAGGAHDLMRPTVAHVPNAKLTIAAAGGQPAHTGVKSKSRRPFTPGIEGQCEWTLARCIPEFQDAVRTKGSDSLTIGAQLSETDSAGVSHEGGKGLLCGLIPHTDDAIGSGGQNASPVVTKPDIRGEAMMRGQLAAAVAVHVPQMQILTIAHTNGVGLAADANSLS